MRCKPGDLAVYVGEDEADLGRIVTCIRLDPLGQAVMGVPCWVTEPSLMRLDRSGPVRSTADCALQPIRPQPDDAVDESLTALWLPSKELA